MKERIYICHTFYHVYITVVKELNIRLKLIPGTAKDDGTGYGEASILLSTMSNDFGNIDKRLLESGLFKEVYFFDEKEDVSSEEVMRYHRDRKNTLLNLFQRILYTKKLGKLQEKHIPVNLREYKDIYVYCDSDPIGYYLCANKIYYHAIEDGLDCIAYYDTARFSNRGSFKIKAALAALGLIFIENGYSKYCIDMEVNNISLLKYPTSNMKEVPRRELYNNLRDEDRQTIVNIFLENPQKLLGQIETGKGRPAIMILSEPLCDLETRKRIFKDIIREYGQGKLVYIKPHPRDTLDYGAEFPESMVIGGRFPMEVMNDVPGLYVDKLISVFTQVKNIDFAGECILLGEDFMDRYEAPEIHRQNEVI